MKLSLWILKEALLEYEPEIKCVNAKIDIEEIRLIDAAAGFESGILYVGYSDQFFHDGKRTIACFHKTDYLILHTDQLFSVLNQLLSVFAWYAQWAEKCQEMISNGCSLPELLTMGEHIFKNPLHIVDASQFLIASSSSATNLSYPGNWANYLENRTAPLDQLKQFNKAYPDTFQRIGVFHLPGEYFPTSSYCKNIFINNERFATVILVEQTLLPEESTSHLLEVFVPILKQWIESNLAADSAYNLTSHFARSLDGSPDAIPSLARRLSLFGWEEECPKQIYVASIISEQFHFDAHLSRLLTSEASGVYAIPYQKKLVLLCNLSLISDEGTFRSHLEKTFYSHNYYAACSFPFTELKSISQAFQQAQLALAQGTPESGRIFECKQIAMKYISSIVCKYSNINLLHPILKQIETYDSANRTDYYRTLFCYLKNERNHQRTSDELFIHRNTLFLRLNKITALWPLDLESPEERFYLLYSFYQQEYAK